MGEAKDDKRDARGDAFTSKFYRDIADGRAALEDQLEGLIDAMQSCDDDARLEVEGRLRAAFNDGVVPQFSMTETRAAWRAVAADLVAGREPLPYTRVVAGVLMAAALDDPHGFGSALNPRGRGRPPGAKTRRQLRATEAKAIAVACGWLADDGEPVRRRGESLRDKAAAEAGMSIRTLERKVAKRRKKNG